MNCAQQCFKEGGWAAVWEGLANKKVRPDEAASLAENMAKQLEERPPLDPFWLEGATTLKKTNVSPSIRAKTFLCWLNRADKDGWDKERLNFEVNYLLDTNFLSWEIESDWQNGSCSLAEATLFEIPREDIFQWKWNWKYIRKSWWAASLEHHPARLEQAIAQFEKSRDKWGPKEIELAGVALEVWASHPETKNKSSLGSAAMSSDKMAIWEKAILNYNHQLINQKFHRLAL